MDVAILTVPHHLDRHAEGPGNGPARLLEVGVAATLTGAGHTVAPVQSGAGDCNNVIGLVSGSSEGADSRPPRPRVIARADGVANGHAVDGGPSLGLIEAALKTVAVTGRISSATICSYDPAFDRDGRAAAAGIRLLGSLAAH